MSEFGNRITAQRSLLRIVNSKMSGEELCGLSEPTITRWLSEHKIENESNISTLLKLAADKLFFLANKSQEQVTTEYLVLVDDFKLIVEKVKQEILIISQKR